ncbi:hypothetical protein DSECCO2_484910 [anaerobic digester metagenome]
MEYTKDEESLLFLNPKLVERGKRIYREDISGKSLLEIIRSLEGDAIANAI